MEDLTEQEKKLIQKADNNWVRDFGRVEATDINKIRYASRQGKYNMEEQKIRDAYFRKLGLWTDGKTTLKEREQQLIAKKEEFGRKIIQIRTSKIDSLDSIIQKAQEKKKLLNKIPKQLQQEYNIEKNKILATLVKELEVYYNATPIEEELNSKIRIFTQKIEARKQEMIEGALEQISNLQKKQKAQIETEINNFSAELEAELSILEYINKDDFLTQQYNEDIKVINQEINSLDVKKEGSLEDRTVSELKEIADQKGLNYDSRIRKAELIELIEG
jgi:hypothetical protein